MLLLLPLLLLLLLLPTTRGSNQWQHTACGVSRSASPHVRSSLPVLPSHTETRGEPRCWHM